MAHNYYRIPCRIRLKALKEMSPSEGEVLSRSKCRRHRRKVRFLLNDFARREAKNGAWMETHIWHAKRFKMQSRWGVKYPLRCSDKADRSTYRLSQHNSAVIQDKSYYKHYQIVPTSVPDYLKSKFGLTISEQYLLQPVYLDAEMRTSELIGPCSLLVYQTVILVQVHPSVTV